MQSLKKVLKNTLDKTGVKKNIEANKTHLIWADVVGEKISKNVETREIKKGVLY